MRIPVGLKIKTLRTLHDIYQADLAEQAGINRQILINIETGRVIPGQEQIDAINAIFGLDLNSPEVDAAFLILGPQETPEPACRAGSGPLAGSEITPSCERRYVASVPPLLPR